MSTFVVVVLITLLLVAALRLWTTANRLDRLHVRTEAAWAALEGALSRRIVATRAAAAAGAFAGADAARLRQLTSQADRAERAIRADAENDLSRALATQPPVLEPGLAAELTDAGERVALARRFYNDAVRDTRALRAVWFTRLFRLAGRAALPDYFEIADQLDAGPALRLAARAVLLDAQYRVLLFSGADQAGTRIWFPVGGAVHPGEEPRGAVVRVLSAQTGLRVPAAEVIGPIWRRFAGFVITGVSYEQTESFFVVCAPPGFAVQPDSVSTTPSDRVSGRRWFSAAEIADGQDTVYPRDLGRRLGEAAAAVAPGAEPPVVSEIS